ncbi:MAG: hypothetical protein J3R72DRAFT_455306 [Linnemannia gamsii]|nr:MAG: hypothetical protein J3R72DRAFT_455306 [Linnemannia gamsii]
MSWSISTAFFTSVICVSVTEREIERGREQRKKKMYTTPTASTSFYSVEPYHGPVGHSLFFPFLLYPFPWSPLFLAWCGNEQRHETKQHQQTSMIIDSFLVFVCRRKEG